MTSGAARSPRGRQSLMIDHDVFMDGFLLVRATYSMQRFSSFALTCTPLSRGPARRCSALEDVAICALLRRGEWTRHTFGHLAPGGRRAALAPMAVDFADAVVGHGIPGRRQSTFPAPASSADPDAGLCDLDCMTRSAWSQIDRTRPASSWLAYITYSADGLDGAPTQIRWRYMDQGTCC